MLKILLKKQVYELFALLFLGIGKSSNKKKKKSKSGRVALTILFVFLFVSLFITSLLLCFAMVGPMVSAGYSWLYFGLFGIAALIISIFVNAFMANSMLFGAKDNMFLLSLPIHPKFILFARMSVLALNCFIVEAFVWIPAIIAFTAVNSFNFGMFLSQIIMFIFITMISVAFACLIGWIIAILTRNKTSKIILSVVASVLLFVIIFGMRFVLNQAIVGMLNNIEEVGTMIANKVYPVFLFGKASCGDVLSLIIVAMISLAVFCIICFIMSKTFLRVVSNTKGAKYKTYKAGNQKISKLNKCLLNKEWSFFLKTPVYLINCGIGVLFFVVLIVITCFQLSEFKEFISAMYALQNDVSDFPFNLITSFFPIAIIAIAIFLTGMCTITTPSISVEGKSIWILKSLPVKPIDIFKAKIRMHVTFCYIPAVIFVIFFGVLAQINVVCIIIMLLSVLVIMTVVATFGLIIGLKRANLVWTNITIPIKQNLGVLFSMLFSFFLAIIFCLCYGFLCLILSSELYLCLWIIICAFVFFIMYKWLKTKGTQEFLEL